ncbi:hypothetical protein ACTXJQ_17955 [Glutamicibacter ardleyensis]
MKRRIISGLFVAIFAVSAAVAPVHASETQASDTADYLAKLESIAGKPATYVSAVQPSGNIQVAQPAANDPAGCKLFPSKTHLRKSGNYGTVGAKPYTVCNSRITSIKQSSTLYIVEWAGMYSKPMMSRDSASRGEKTLTQKNLSWTCGNSNKSKFQQVTRGTTTVGAKNYFSIVSTVKDTWACGY